MDYDTIQDESPSVGNVSSGEMEAKSISIDSLEVVSSVGDMTHLVRAVESVRKVELDLACSSEKLVNLNILAMHVASIENDFEAFVFEEDRKHEGSVEKAFQFDLLYGILESEVKELDSFLSDLHLYISTSGKILSSAKQLDGDFRETEKKFQDCEESLKCSMEQLAEIKVQSATFRRILLSASGEGVWNYAKELNGVGNGNLYSGKNEIKMQTVEQRKHVLKMLEKSLAQEMDLEKKLAESRKTEEDVKFKLQQEVLCIEEEAEFVWERLFEAQTSSEIMVGISRELYQKIQTAELNLNNGIQREEDLRSQCRDLSVQLKYKDHVLLDTEHARAELVEKVSELEQKLSELLSQVHSTEDVSEKNKGLSSNIYGVENNTDGFNEKLAEEENSGGSDDTDFKLVRESNMELNNELSRLKNSIDDSAERVEQLETQLRESETKRLHAEASAEANEEKNRMLNCTIVDMENLINDLKSKVYKAERQTESFEDKCNILFESNADLVGEINSIRGRNEFLEKSVHQADEARKKTAKDVRMYTKFIDDLVAELAIERERLHKQIVSVQIMKTRGGGGA